MPTFSCLSRRDSVVFHRSLCVRCIFDEMYHFVPDPNGTAAGRYNRTRCDILIRFAIPPVTVFMPAYGLIAGEPVIHIVDVPDISEELVNMGDMDVDAEPEIIPIEDRTAPKSEIEFFWGVFRAEF